MPQIWLAPRVPYLRAGRGEGKGGAHDTHVRTSQVRMQGAGIIPRLGPGLLASHSQREIGVVHGGRQRALDQGGAQVDLAGGINRKEGRHNVHVVGRTGGEGPAHDA